MNLKLLYLLNNNNYILRLLYYDNIQYSKSDACNHVLQSWFHTLTIFDKNLLINLILANSI